MLRHSYVLLLAFVACGGLAGPSDQSQIVGSFFVTTGADVDTFAAELQPYVNQSSSTSACPGATMVVGSCCPFPAPRPPPFLGVGDGGAGGPAVPELSAGSLTFSDGTTSATVSTFGFGDGLYEGVPATYPAGAWQPGDTLTVSAAGDQIDAFTISAPALVPPAPSFPSALSLSESLTVAWQPDPNADTIAVSFDDASGAVVECTVPDAQGKVTFDASLFTEYASGASLQASAQRQTQREITTPNGRIVLETFGWGSNVFVSAK
ncbi:MAG TPA: hypothetical protein VGH28_17565 [Polyangiaceae bacterium]|jgi:hypothetical protein